MTSWWAQLRLKSLKSPVYSRRWSKKTSKLRVTGLCEGNSPVTGEFFARRASNAKNVSIWWRHHGMLNIIALWWWFCPCCVRGAMWFHTAFWCLYPQNPFFNSHFLFGNKYGKTSLVKILGNFDISINLLPLVLIWRSAPCLKHWNQSWLGEAVFTLPSGKQWDHRSPWSHRWLSADSDECCKSASEIGRYRLKNSLLATIWHYISKMNGECNIFNHQQWRERDPSAPEGGSTRRKDRSCNDL